MPEVNNGQFWLSVARLSYFCLSHEIVLINSFTSLFFFHFFVPLFVYFYYYILSLRTKVPIQIKVYCDEMMLM